MPNTIENIDFQGKNILLTGEDKEVTIIDGDNNGHVVLFNNKFGNYVSTSRNYA